MKSYFLVTVFVAVSFLFSCSSKFEKCDPEASRCSVNLVQICDSDGNWVTILDCSEVSAEEPFSCQQDTDGLHACLPSVVDPPDVSEDVEGDLKEDVDEDLTEDQVQDVDPGVDSQLETAE